MKIDEKSLNEIGIRGFFILGLSFLLVMILGIWGFSISYSTNGIQYGIFDIVYSTLQLFVLEFRLTTPVNNIQLQIARFLAPVLTLSTLTILICVSIESFQKISLQFKKNHIIICGLGYLGPRIGEYYAQNSKVVIIEKNPDNPEIPGCKDYGATVLIGDATDEKLLKRAHIQKAKEIFIVTGNDEVNAEIAVKCNDIVNEANSSINCHIHFESPFLHDMFNMTNARAKQSESPISMDFFNLYKISGYCIQKMHVPYTETDLENGTPHILVLGAGRMGETLITKTTKKWLRWQNESGESSKIQITCIDRDAEKKEQQFNTLYPSLSSHCELAMIPIDLTSPEYIYGDFMENYAKNHPFTRIYFCIDDSSIAVSTALMFQNIKALKDVPIVIRTTQEDGISMIFETLKKKCKSLSHIETFQIVSSPCCMKIITGGTREILARAIHENYRTMKLKEGINPAEDDSMKVWIELDPALQESNRQQADHVQEKLYDIHCYMAVHKDLEAPEFDFKDKEIEYLAEKEHERWCEERLSDGWEKGPVKDVIKKISPYLIPYQDLPEEIKEYNRDAVRMIPSILDLVDLKVVRLDSSSAQETTIQNNQ